MARTGERNEPPLPRWTTVLQLPDPRTGKRDHAGDKVSRDVWLHSSAFLWRSLGVMMPSWMNARKEPHGSL